VREILGSETIADLRDANAVKACVDRVKPEVVFHLAAQAVVRRSYQAPIETLETNILGTSYLLEALRLAERPSACVVVTSDKCYENDNSGTPLSETAPMGGHDIYSASKGAAEVVVSSYRRSFFGSGGSPVALASGRAGNVIGGGDYTVDRIVPDCISALARGKAIAVRNPDSVRPWQHVLEPLSGYLTLAEKLLSADAHGYCEGWNFGPNPGDTHSVRKLVEGLIKHWGSGSWVSAEEKNAPREAVLLRLSIEKAEKRLGWRPRWDLDRTLSETVAWYKAFAKDSKPGSLREFTLKQIEAYGALG
jgi:CDP-glucose 4,6-dehydratase